MSLIATAKILVSDCCLMPNENFSSNYIMAGTNPEA
jgi:hypothetical protein